jgi:hypothetical protein
MRYGIYLIGVLFLFSNIYSQERKFTIYGKDFIPWAIMEKDGKHYCPGCGEEHEVKDYTKLPSKLSLSEWHANNLDSSYFENHIANVYDKDLFTSLDFSKLPGYNKKEIKEGDYKRAAEMLDKIKKNEKDNQRLIAYTQYDEMPFITIDEYNNLLKSNPAKRDTMLKMAEDISDLKFQYGPVFIDLTSEKGFNSDLGGNRKYGFNYFSWLMNLPAAYMLTKDNKYVKAFDEIIKLWYKQRNSITNTLPQFDVIWYELGLAARLPVLVDAYRVFKDNPALSMEARDCLFKTFLATARWLYEAMSRNPYHPYNWPIASAISLTYLSLNFPEYKESKNWLSVGMKAMEEHMKRDAHEDGGYAERAPGYSMLAYKYFYRYVSMIKYFTSDKEYYGKYKAQLEKMMQFFVYVCSPLGTACPFNDSRRGSMSDFIYANGKDRSDFMGPIEPYLNEEQRKQTGKITSPKETSINLESSGFAVMRTEWSKDAMMMIINWGPAANHAHESILDFEMYAYGNPLAVDAGHGQFGYDDRLYKPWYKKAKSHNMLIVNDSSIVRGEANVHDVRWSSQNHIDYFSGTHDGYKKYFGISHKRSIAFVKSQYWVIKDNLLNASGNLKTKFLLHSPLDLEIKANGYESKVEPGYSLLVPEGEKVELKLQMGEADLSGLPGYNNQTRDINYAVIEKKANTKDYIVLIYPFKKKDGEIHFKKIENKEGIIGAEVINNTNTDNLFFFDGKKHSLPYCIETDAEFVYLKMENGKLKTVSISAGTYFKKNEKILLDSQTRQNKEFDF